MARLESAIRYPSTREDWYIVIAIGGVLTLLSFLILPLILVYGYLVRLIRERLTGATEPPPFEDWTDLFVDGIQAWVIGLVYLLIPLLIVVATVGGTFLSVIMGGETVGIGTILGMFGGLFVAGVLALVFWYAAAAGIVNFARTGSLAAAFAVADIKPVLLDRRYAVAWLLALVIILAAGFIGAMLSAIPVIGTIIAAFIGFYAQMVAALFWADGFAESRESGVEPRDVVEETTA